MQILENISLKPFNTFGIEAKARYFIELNSTEEITGFIQNKLDKKQNRLILGGGSNILLTKDFDGIVIKINSKGIEKTRETDEYVFIRSQAGENWEDFVNYCIENNWAGLENLSLIPGNVGTSPMQNVGAYGVEIKDVFHELEAVEIETGKLKTFDKKSCSFGYRYSVFKGELKDKYIITSVTFRLSKKPVLNISYGAIRDELKRMNIENLNIKAIGQAVCNIRRSKLPEPEKLGNAGSFFKNPVVDHAKLQGLKSHFPDIVSYKVDDNHYKIAAGWLIEKAGLKGLRYGNAGVHDKQALVIVNHGGATGNDIFELSERVIHTVNDMFGIELEREVNVV